MLATIADFFRNLAQTTGLNFTVLYDSYDATNFFDGIVVTLELTVLSIAASIVIGVVGAFLQSTGTRWLRLVVNGFVSIFRNTPPLVQIFFFYFGIGGLLPTSYNEIGLAEPFLTNFQWAVLALSLFAGAFNVEIFRSGIEAGPRTTVEAAEALGYTRLGQYRHVVLPLALALPAGFALTPLVVVTQTLVELVAMVVLVAVVPRLVRHPSPSA